MYTYKTHLIGHISRNYPQLIMTTCKQRPVDPRDLNVTIVKLEVNCRSCLFILSNGVDSDPVTKYELGHMPCWAQIVESGLTLKEFQVKLQIERDAILGKIVHLI